MDIGEILKYPTNYNHTHESVYRCYHILEKVEWMLAHNTPPAVILDFIQSMDALRHLYWDETENEFKFARLTIGKPNEQEPTVLTG